MGFVCNQSICFACSCSGIECSRSCPEREHCPSEGEEPAEELEEMDVHSNNHPSHNRGDNRGGSDQAME